MARLAWTSVSAAPRTAVAVLRIGARTLRRSFPRTVVYEPDVDGTADPGEVVWADVTFAEDERVSKDRPLLVVGRVDDEHVCALLLSSRPRRGQRWMALGAGDWDRQRRRSWVRLDRVLELHEAGLRREGCALDAGRFAQVREALRTRHGWS